MQTLLPYEHQIMQMLLAGEHPWLEILRQQFENIEVTAREFTGCGFFTDFHVPDRQALPTTMEQIVIEDIQFEAKGIEHGGGFLLFLEKGKIDTLECYTYGDDVFSSKPQFTRF